MPEKQAEVQAELMAEAFVFNMDALVTKDYLEAKLDSLEARIDGKFRLIYWMLAIIIASTTLPALQNFFAG